jgi:hypothetical protein
LILEREVAAPRVVVPEKQTTQITEAVVQGHDDEAVVAGVARSVEPRPAPGTAKEGSAVNPEQHRGVAGEIGAPDVEIQAVLGGDGVRAVVVVLCTGNEQRQGSMSWIEIGPAVRASQSPSGRGAGKGGAKRRRATGG